ncbi:MAG TPA: menaquinone-dependent protoporphyrinogen IX dehydrogenase [Bdellovibrionales bacterium]|nr:menaquinone-dependent protoporphyrinogen IX dehydrogenase [Bdellovibrionales bacterium]
MSDIHSKKILVLYGTKEGQTEKIARAIAAEIRRAGHVVDLIDAEEAPATFDPEDYDGAILGSPVHMSSFTPAVRAWVRSNGRALAKVPTAFFSVCLGILQKEDEKTQKAERQIVEDFFTKSGWRPQEWTIFAGALTYSKYDWFTRQIMKMIVSKAGGDTDSSRDYEYTDWSEVQRFAQKFATLVAGRPPLSRQPAVGM